jgi:glycosyltransferase involved in cell wall biosynthesis
MGLLDNGPIVVAPRGELSPGALEIKNIKKHIYLLISRLAGFYRGVVWHVSTDYEAEDIARIFPWTKDGSKIDSQLIRIAPDPFLLPIVSLSGREMPPLHKEPGKLRIIFISRISRKKNLEYALRLLSELTGSVEFDIYGPCEDKAYWAKCRSFIKTLPPNINVAYRGIANSNDVRSLFSRYHMFLFPTRGENFGHVIPEALSSGCLVLVSDQTPWRGLAQKEIGWDVGLADPNGYVRALNAALAMDDVEFSRRSMAARQFMQDYYQQRMLELDDAYARLFDVTPGI